MVWSAAAEERSDGDAAFKAVWRSQARFPPHSIRKLVPHDRLGWGRNLPWE